MSRSSFVVVVVLGLLSASVACVPPSNECDPENPEAGGAILTGAIQLGLHSDRDDHAAPAPGVVDVVLSDGSLATTDDEGRYRFELEPGTYSVSASAIDFLDATDGPFVLSACETVDVEKPLVLWDRSEPTPLVIGAPPAYTSSPDIVLTIAAHGADDNMRWYDYRVNGGEWEAEEWSVEEWTIALDANQLNRIAFRSRDGRQNVSAEGFVETIHDDIPPSAPSGLVVDAGPGRIDISWIPSTDANLAGYAVAYGDDPAALFGATANEGLSPIALGPDATSLRLTGLVDGHPLFLRIDAHDRAGLTSSSAVVTATPAVVTPVVVRETELAATPSIAVIGDRFGYAIVDGLVESIDLWRGESAGTFVNVCGPEGARDLALFGDLVVVACADQVVMFDVGYPDAAELRVQIEIPTTAPCDGIGGCPIAAIDVSQAMLTFAFASPAGLWRLPLDDVSAIDDADFVTHPPLFLADVQEELTGPIRRFGKFVAVGSTAVGGVTAQSAITIVDEGLQVVCGRITPTAFGDYAEIFTATDELGAQLYPDPAPRVVFDVSGDTFAVPFDGSVVVMSLGDDENGNHVLQTACDDVAFGGFFPAEWSTATSTIGRYETGYLTARAVALAGGTLAVATEQRLPEYFGDEAHVDIVSLDALTSTVGAQDGIVTSLAREGRLDRHAVALAWDGPYLRVVGKDVAVVEVFHPTGLVPLASGGENPTGANVGYGRYVVHQRTLLGTAMFDVAHAGSPVSLNGATCVPGCFADQDLAGRPEIDGGLMFSPFNGVDSGQPRALGVVDTASDPGNPFTVTSIDNPCPTGSVSGYARGGARAFVGCAEDPRVVAIDVSDVATGGAPVVVPAGGVDDALLADDVRALTIVPLRAPGAARALVVLDRNGSLTFLGVDWGDVAASPTLVEGPIDIGLDYGTDLYASAGRLFVLGGNLANPCDPTALACTGITNQLVVVDVDSRDVLYTTETGSEEHKQTLAVYDELVVIGAQRTGNPYSFYRVSDDELTLLSIASPNPLALSAIVHGGHLFTAAMQVFALE